MKRLLATAGASPRPITTTIELTASCPLACVHCYVSPDKPERLSLAVLTRLFAELAELGGLFLSLTGGEVALRGDLAAIIAAARARRFSVTLLSSGTLWREPDWDELLRLEVDSVRLSLYGADPAVHDAVTQRPGSQARTLATASGLLARGIAVDLSCPILAQNAGEIGEVVALGRALGCGVNLDPVITWTESGVRAPAGLRIAPAALAQVLADPRVREALGDSGQVAGAAALSPEAAPCQVGRTAAFVDCAGEVRPCASWPQSAGSILAQPFAEIWRRGPALVAARALVNRDLTACGACALRATCSPCAAVNLQEHGSVGTAAQVICDRTRGVTG